MDRNEHFAAGAGLSKDSLESVAAAGHVTDEWSRWQQGDCYTYAHALLRVKPSLKLGSLDQGMHLFAHDETHAYDSAGKHKLPYTGIHGGSEQELNVGHDWYDGPHEPHIPDAIAHIKRNKILER